MRRDDVWLIMVVCALAFHLFRYQIAMAFTIGFYGLSTAMVAGQMWFASMQGADLAAGWQALQIFGSAAVLLGFIDVMSHYRNAGATIANRIRIDERVGVV